MDAQNTTDLSAPVLGQLLLMQSVLCSLPDEPSIFSFICRGLQDLPGVSEVSHSPDCATDGDPTLLRLPLQTSGSSWGDLCLRISDPAAFGPYLAYIKNFVVMVAVILHGRQQRRLNEEHKRELAQRVEERTRQLTSEIAERKLVEEELRRSRNMLAHTLDSVPQAVFWKDRSGRYLGCNRVFARSVGLASPAQIVGKTDADLRWALSDTAAYREADHSVLTLGQSRRHLVEPLPTPEGGCRWIDMTKVPLTDDQGQVDGVLGVVEDITERKEAEAERERLNEKLTQAQKMESIGRLAGGVAHDFNNMLQAILGYAELALHEGPGSVRYRESLEEVRKAATRSADLTHHLLAFARKQTVSPKVLDLNETVSNMLKMLRRLIGEDLQLSWIPGPGLWHVWIDPVQIDQLLANLTVNARDSIQSAGEIAISTANETLTLGSPARPPEVKPGEYVTLAVRDTGCGIDAETQEHLFEPFFTTKPVGQGTGLGLATVYGIVKQNHGFITVESAPGRGSLFTIHLPRCHSTPHQGAGALDEQAGGGSETVLLVEDEELVLGLARRLLEQQGYHVLAARLPEEALAMVRTHAGRIDLMITDVVMPGMSGRELHARLAHDRPGLLCLYMSGYPAEFIARQGVLEPGVEFLAKPFSAADLRRKVRQLLDGH